MHIFPDASETVRITEAAQGEREEICVTSQVAHWVKNSTANAGDTRDAGSIPGSGRSPGEENGNPLQYSCLENPMDRGAWWARVHGVPESDTTEHTHAHLLTELQAPPDVIFIFLQRLCLYLLFNTFPLLVSL